MSIKSWWDRNKPRKYHFYNLTIQARGVRIKDNDSLWEILVWAANTSQAEKLAIDALCHHNKTFYIRHIDIIDCSRGKAFPGGVIHIGRLMTGNNEIDTPFTPYEEEI